jgi:hypothetical protein
MNLQLIIDKRAASAGISLVQRLLRQPHRRAAPYIRSSFKTDYARVARLLIYRAANILHAVTERLEHAFALFANVPYRDSKTRRELMCLLDDAKLPLD